MPPVRTLIVSAWEPELAPLRRLLRGAPVARELALEAVGVGTVDAAVGAAHALARTRPRRVLFVGTAGVYPGATARALPIGAAAVAGELRLVSTATLRGDAYAPAPLVAAAETTPALRAQLERAAAEAPPAVTVACPLAITHTAALARRIAATGAALENLEAFGVARAAASARVPFAAVLGVSNVVGPRAHAEWRANHLAASRAACHVVWSFLRPPTRRAGRR
jgi:purine-nucleoside phosphorylase